MPIDRGVKHESNAYWSNTPDPDARGVFKRRCQPFGAKGPAKEVLASPPFRNR